MPNREAARPMLPQSATDAAQGLARLLKGFSKGVAWQRWLAALACIGFWWLSTAAIIYFNFQPEYRLAVFTVAFAGLVWGFYTLYTHRDTESTRGATLAFLAAAFVWTFVEVSFYTGYIVGPQIRPIFTVGPSLVKFYQAIHRSLYHELLVVAFAVTLSVMLAQSKNKFGLYTFLLLWLMHQSTKMNIFFGVLNLNRDFIPEPVAEITNYMSVASMNWFFPVSITLCTLVTYRLLQHASGEREAWKRIGYTLVGTMSVLATLEHWLLVLPLDQTLWDIVIKRFQ